MTTRCDNCGCAVAPDERRSEITSAMQPGDWDWVCDDCYRDLTGKEPTHAD